MILCVDESQQQLAAAVAASYHAREELRYQGNEELSPPPKKKRGAKCVMARCTKDGTLEVISPKESNWYLMYVNNPMVECERSMHKLRRRFRFPYEIFQKLVHDCKNQEIFSRWMGKSAPGKEASPIESLIRGTLQYLGRGWTVDDLEEATAVSQEVHHIFFHRFIEFGSTTLHDRHVTAPINFEEAKRHMHEFTIAGVPGALGSSDATHVTTESCEYNLRCVTPTKS